ncbi:uncharacterized protein N0V89_010024 [Didymosphaeria variabile]|uniref:Uncharacterized protein n=1 Tax=Didymosphaeria variabile TaxID=1932322 RepID=A0A9W8XEF4_9PLEO|nr:uncharacterized protein N0V89_010024 [Didymosphaeria variabile]KAJ4348646.1 hypothetical protein N0V89_010024 [Didymosphaeria variabile]
MKKDPFSHESTHSSHRKYTQDKMSSSTNEIAKVATDIGSSSSGALPDINSLSIGDDGLTTNTPSATAAGETSTTKTSVPTEPDNSNFPSNRAAMVAKAQAAKNSKTFTTPSASAKLSARLKTSNYKPILAAGKGSASRLAQMQKEAAEKKAKEEEEAKAQEQENKAKAYSYMLNYANELLQSLPDEAISDLPDDFYKLELKVKLKLLLELRAKYGEQGPGEASGTTVGELEETGPVPGELDEPEDLEGLESSKEDSKEHTECVCDECKESQGDMSGGARGLGETEPPSI